MEEASVSDVGGCQDEEFLSTLRRWQKCKEMGGKRQGKGKAKLDVNPDGSLGTEAPIDVAPNQLHRKGTLLAQCCVVRSFPDLGTPWETLGFPGSPLGMHFLQFLDQFWFHFWSLFWGPVLGPALIKYIKGGQKQDPKKGPKMVSKMEPQIVLQCAPFAKFKPHFCTSPIVEGGRSSKGSGLALVAQGLSDNLR